ncbi:MAG TPA: hypothetical protein VGF45_16350 [Polyangia bacterium]
MSRRPRVQSSVTPLASGVWWAGCVRVAIALLLAACTGPTEIPIGSAGAATFYLSPDGRDDHPGSRAQPWRSFRAALPRLGPGTTLVLLSGIYDTSTSGALDIRCGETTSDGRAGAPITVRADEERQAFIRGDGTSAPAAMDDCAHWIIDGLRVEAADNPAGSPGAPESGSVFVLTGDNRDLILRRLLLARPNRYRHSHVLRIGDGASNVTVEECELYDFHHNGFEVARANATVFRRNYLHSRLAEDIPRGYVSPAGSSAARGDFGFVLEETRLSIVEDNIAEAVSDGFGIVGRFEELPSDDPPVAPNPLDGNRWGGNVALASSGSGFLLACRCRGRIPCNDRARLVIGTELIDNVAIGGRQGLASRGSIATRIQQFSAHGSEVGVTLGKSSDNEGIAATSFTSNSLAIDHEVAGFQSEDEADGGFDHCGAVGTGPAFSPQDGRVTAALVPDPAAVGACLVYLPPGSPLRTAGAGAQAVGGEITRRHENGIATAQPLWDPVTGAFPCGAVVPGVNDDPGQSCIGVHQRLRVGTAGCPLPP